MCIVYTEYCTSNKHTRTQARTHTCTHVIETWLDCFKEIWSYQADPIRNLLAFTCGSKIIFRPLVLEIPELQTNLPGRSCGKSRLGKISRYALLASLTATDTVAGWYYYPPAFWFHCFWWTLRFSELSRFLQCSIFWYFWTTTVLAPTTPTTPRVASNSEWKSEREPLRVFVVASQTFMLGWSGPVSHEWDSFMLHSSAVCVSWLCDLLDKPLQAILCGYHQVFSGDSSVSWALHIVDYSKPPCRCIWQKMTKELSNKNHPKPFLSLSLGAQKLPSADVFFSLMKPPLPSLDITSTSFQTCTMCPWVTSKQLFLMCRARLKWSKKRLAYRTRALGKDSGHEGHLPINRPAWLQSCAKGARFSSSSDSNSLNPCV